MKHNRITRLVLLTLICIVSFGCSRAYRSPTDLLIEGPFIFDNEWQTIQFKEPLKVLPHIHELRFLFARGKYGRTGFMGQSANRINGYGFAMPGGRSIIEPQVILITRNGKQFKTVQGNSGHWEIRAGHFDFIAVSTNARAGKFYFPKGTEFVAAKIKSNVKLEVEHLYWLDYSWPKNPQTTWDNIEPSKIVELQ